MHREDVENETAPVNHLHLKDLLKATLLCWRKFVVSDEERKTGLRFRSE
jgi:hypothetical protein